MLSVASVAKRLNVSESCVRAWLASGRLRGAKLANTTWRITPEALAEFVAAGEACAIVTMPARRVAPRPAVDDWAARLERL